MSCVNKFIVLFIIIYIDILFVGGKMCVYGEFFSEKRVNFTLKTQKNVLYLSRKYDDSMIHLKQNAICNLK